MEEKGLIKEKSLSFLDGVKDSIPICLGYLSVSFAFGIFCVSSGLTILEAVLISMTNVTSAGQLAGVPIMVSGGTLLEMMMTQFVINLRYALMSVSLSQKLDNSVKPIHRFLMAFVITDETFAVSAGKPCNISKSYFFGLILMPYLGWSLGTLLGAALGNVLPLMVTAALGVAIYGMFIAIVVPCARDDKNVLACVAIAIVLSCILYFIKAIPQGFQIIICSVIASTIMAIVAPIKEDNN